MREETKKFIKISRNQLKTMFQDRLDSLKENVFIMKAGEERDAKILFVKEYQQWLTKIEVLTGEKKEGSKEPDYI